MVAKRRTEPRCNELIHIGDVIGRQLFAVAASSALTCFPRVASCHGLGEARNADRPAGFLLPQAIKRALSSASPKACSSSPTHSRRIKWKEDCEAAARERLTSAAMRASITAVKDDVGCVCPADFAAKPFPHGMQSAPSELLEANADNIRPPASYKFA